MDKNYIIFCKKIILLKKLLRYWYCNIINDGLSRNNKLQCHGLTLSLFLKLIYPKIIISRYPNYLDKSLKHTNNSSLNYKHIKQSIK